LKKNLSKDYSLDFRSTYHIKNTGEKYIRSPNIVNSIIKIIRQYVSYHGNVRFKLILFNS